MVYNVHMHLLIVIGAGASYDAWPKHIHKPSDYDSMRLPLAQSLFAPKPTQDDYLQLYKLMGLASLLRHKANIEGSNFDLEAELEEIYNNAYENRDPNLLQSLFKARFYIQSVINKLTKRTLSS